jgi:hypothetical protein
MKNNDWVPIISVALIWAAVILAVSMALDGSPLAGRVLSLQGGGAAGTLIVLGGWLRAGRKRSHG